MLPIKTILHPTDFSDHSDHAFRLACALARDYGARLLVLHVAEPPTAAAAEGVLMLPPAFDVEPLRERLQQLWPEDRKIPVEHRLVQGDPATEILRVAEEAKTDLIVMGTHGRSGVSRLLMGSVAEALLRKAPCPVLTVKRPSLQTTSAPGKPKAEATKPHAREETAKVNYNDLITVSSVANPVEAEVIRNALRDEGIHCILEGTRQAGVVGTMGIPIQVQVRAGDADRASKLIRTHTHHRP
jgi:nucleotide-binding universal stress UspA family protein